MKELLLDFNPDSPTGASLSVAQHLATRYSASVHCVYPVPPVRLPIPSMSHVLSEAEVTAILGEPKQRVASARAIFDAWSREHKFESRWTSEKASRVELLLQHAGYSDLIVTNGGDRSTALYMRDTTQVIMSSGRPVLFVPDSMPSKSFENIVIAWDGSGESNRALHDAIPLLQRASKSTLLTVQEANKPTHRDANELCARFQHRGITLTPRADQAQAGAEGRLIIKTAADEGADLIVMGAYGHSRLGEFWLGGATHTVLHESEYCVLFAH